jgi:hypothetical protein
VHPGLVGTENLQSIESKVADAGSWIVRYDHPESNETAAIARPALQHWVLGKIGFLYQFLTWRGTNSCGTHMTQSGKNVAIPPESTQ